MEKYAVAGAGMGPHLPAQRFDGLAVAPLLGRWRLGPKPEEHATHVDVVDVVLVLPVAPDRACPA